MKASSSTINKAFQKDLENRKYSSNPFEKQYVDLTTSSCSEGNSTTNDSGLNLDYRQKDLKLRADIISCQVSILFIDCFCSYMLYNMPIMYMLYGL